ncbi:hypothetical protein UlMin_045279 [Ulmus minor]
MIMRRHGWQRPLHPLQIVGVAIYSFLVVAFYTFLGLFLGNPIAEITLTATFSIVAVLVMFLFIRCTAIDPTDKIGFKKKKKPKCKLNYGLIVGQLVLRLFRRVERKILKCLIRRKYLDPLNTNSEHLDPFLPFPLLLKDDSVTPNQNQDDISFCSLCDLEVKKHSKHCRTCNRCVEGFDHHCRWLNNCIGKRNYTTFIFLMVFVLLMLIVEGGTAIAIFVRCFADKHGIERELEKKLYVKFPRGVLAVISLLLLLMTAYGSAALGQLFFFHLVLIRKGIRTYDYILAMKEENQSMQLDPFDDSDFSSDEDSDFESPEKPTFVSRFICRGRGASQNPSRLSIKIEGDPRPSLLTNKKGFRVSIDPWKLITLSKEKALRAAEKARERIAIQKPIIDRDPLKPLPLETKLGPLMNTHRNIHETGTGSTPLISKSMISGTTGMFSASPRRRYSCSPKHKYRSSFDLKLTDVSRELETYISRQVLSSVIKEDGCQPSPR